MTAVDTRRATVVTEIAGRGRRPGPNHRSLDPDRSWVERGACYNAPALADLFYPSKADAVEAYATARAVCARCDVRLACLDYAVATGETLGMWGGRTPKERREIARRRRAFTRRVDEVRASREDTPE